MIEFKFSDFFYPLDLVQTYLLLRRSEHWTSAQVLQYQASHLAKLLRFSSQWVPYYQDLFREQKIDAGNLDAGNALSVLKSLPILDKDLVRENPGVFVSGNSERFHPKLILTSGTTGTPLKIYWDRGSNVMEFCAIQRLWRWAGFRIGEPFLDLRSRVFSGQEKHYVEDAGVRYLRDAKVNALEFSSDIIDDENVRRYYEVLLRYKPKLVRGHPQSIVHLANLLEAHQLTDWRPKAVTTASEALHVFQRQQITRAWGVPVLDSYGLREHNVFIAQCREGSYHINPEYGICEILDDQGMPVEPGQEGWIVATGLHNYAQPLIRYNTRDRAIAGDHRPCRCGRGLPTVERIIGRIDDCIYASDGRRYSGLSFAFFGRRGIKKARLVQEDYHLVKVELVTQPDFDQSERAALLQALDEKVQGKIKFEVQCVADIVQGAPGKFKFVVSRLGEATHVAKGAY